MFFFFFGLQVFLYPITLFTIRADDNKKIEKMNSTKTRSCAPTLMSYFLRVSPFPTVGSLFCFFFLFKLKLNATKLLIK